MFKFSPKEIAIINSIKADETKKSHTNLNMRTLNRIYNRGNGLTEMYCLCTKSDRAVFYKEFYDWFDTVNPATK